jgi:pimeloyl-ACP methyl ester carboxylesterase
MAVVLTAGCSARAPGGPKAPEPAKDAVPSMMSRKEVTSIVADTRKVVSPNGIEELKEIPVNGTMQWISIRGKDKRNPILLYVHGGPGSPTMPEDYTFQSPWEDFFTVVQWDQRGAGKTYGANDPKALDATMTLPQIVDDAAVVTQYLTKTFAKKKIFLLGHSWGSAVAVTLAHEHPERFYAYLGTGQMVDGRRSEAEGYQFALDQAVSHHNDEAVKELKSLAPYPGPAPLTLERLSAQRKWLQYYGGLTWGRTDYLYDANAWTLSPDYTNHDLDQEGDGSLYSITHLLTAAVEFNAEAMTSFKCPIFLFEGRHDYSVSHTLAEDWFKRIVAPEKKLIWFEDSAHMAMQEQAGRFLYHMVTDVRPIAVKAGDSAPADTTEGPSLTSDKSPKDD